MDIHAPLIDIAGPGWKAICPHGCPHKHPTDGTGVAGWKKPDNVMRHFREKIIREKKTRCEDHAQYVARRLNLAVSTLMISSEKDLTSLCREYGKALIAEKKQQNDQAQQQAQQQAQ